MASGREVAIEKWVYGGRGLARIDGRAVLVPFVLPGEVVRLGAEKESPGLIEASLAGVVSPSPQRVEPPCPYFGRCGGCHYQHAAYEYQLAQKREVLLDTLRRVGKFEPPEQIRILSAAPWEYRNRIQLHIGKGGIGFREAGSSRLCPVKHCPISSPAVNAALAALREMLRADRFPRFLRSIELFTNESSVQVNVVESERPVARRFFEWCEERIPGAVPGALDYPAAGRLYRVSRKSFFQVNRFLAETLVETVLAGAEGDSAVDLYAGVGLFSLPLAERFGSVRAVESGSSAVRDLEFNAARASLKVEAVGAAAETFLEGLDRPPDFLLADPPRAGLGKPVVRQLLRLRPPRLAIVACDPATLARDLAALIAGGYRIDQLTLIDLFPQTYRLETVVQMGTDAFSA